MEPLFRFQLIRPPVKADANAQIPLTQTSNFQKVLSDQSSNADNLRESLSQFASAFIKPSGGASFDTAFVTNDPPSAFAAKVQAFASQLNGTAASHSLTVQDVTSAAQSAFSSTPGDIIKTSGFTNLQNNLRDSIVAIKLAQQEHNRPIEALSVQLRHLELLQYVSALPATPPAGTDIDKIRGRPLQLPGLGKLKSVFSTTQTASDTPNGAEQAKKDAQIFVQDHRMTKKTIDELMRLNASFLQMNVSNDTSTVGSAPSARSLQETGQMQQTTLGLSLSEAALDRLTPAAKEFLDSKGIDALNEPLPDIVSKLSDIRTNTRENLVNILPEYTKTNFQQVGSSLVAIRTAEPSEAANVVYGNQRWGNPNKPLPEPTVEQAPVPALKGGVKAAGITDLLVVKQTLKGYEGADIGHIENVLKGESKIHENVNTRKNEQSIFAESETASAEERELESTSRFEMSRETDTTLKRMSR